VAKRANPTTAVPADPTTASLSGVATVAETPLARTRRARRMYRLLAQRYPDAHCELDFADALPAARRDGSLRADHGRAGQQGDPDPVRQISRRPRPCRRRSHRARRRSSSPLGFYRAKSESLLKRLSADLVERYDGVVPAPAQ
jgi:endonuclease-3